jgi:transcriptional regulator GlxA family with amidase domain
VLSRIPNVEIRLVGKEVGPVATEGGPLLLGVTHTLAETPSPDLVLVPGGTTTRQMVDDEVLDWLHKMNVLEIMGAKPQPDERIVHSGKIVTAAGVSAGIDLALWLAGEIAGREQAEAIQLTNRIRPASTV